MTVRTPEKSIFEPHPSLGAYVSHHPSRRMWLTLRGAVFYAIPVGLVQLLTLRVADQVAWFILPALYAIIGLVVVWYVAHFWNREIVLYADGFTYREGSQTGHFRYDDIARVQDETEQIRYFGRFAWTRYRYAMHTRYDETLRVTNLYDEVRQLVDSLDRRITRAQLPAARVQIDAGEALDFGAGLRLSREGLQWGEEERFWHELSGYRVRDGRLHLLNAAGETWTALPVRELQNVVLLLALLREGTETPRPPDSSATENANAS